MHRNPHLEDAGPALLVGLLVVALFLLVAPSRNAYAAQQNQFRNACLSKGNEVTREKVGHSLKWKYGCIKRISP
jgi:hypothetical protein